MKFWGSFISFLASLKKSRLKLTLTISIVVLVFLIAGFIIASARYSTILPNTWVNGVSVGGMSQTEAKTILKKRFISQLENREITFKCEDREIVIPFEDMKIKADIDATVDSAYSLGRKYGILSKTICLFISPFKENKLQLVISSDKNLINSVISSLAEGLETDATNMQYSLDENMFTITKGTPGKKINRQKALESILNAAGNPKISELSFKIEPAMPEDIDIDAFLEELSQPARDAYYEYKDGVVTVVDEHTQIIANRADIERAFLSPEQKSSFVVKAVFPEKTKAELEEMLFRDTLASFSSNFASSTAARASNVKLSASRINGHILMPGDIFSYDKTIGKRTAANGYYEAGVYIGNKVENGIGGGICQTSSTLYSAALYANLEIVNRTSHSLPVSYVPAGQDATISEGYIDFKLKNNTEYPIKIIAEVSGRTLTCRILGVKVPDQTVELVHTTIGTSSPKLERTLDETIPVGYKKIANQGANGYTISSKRIVKINGEIKKTEDLTKSVYKAANIEELVNPADENTPSENLIVFTGQLPVIDETQEPEITTPSSGDFIPIDSDINIDSENDTELQDAPASETSSNIEEESSLEDVDVQNDELQ